MSIGARTRDALRTEAAGPDTGFTGSAACGWVSDHLLTGAVVAGQRTIVVMIFFSAVQRLSGTVTLSRYVVRVGESGPGADYAEHNADA
jgi:hypothetical protein